MWTGAMENDRTESVKCLMYLVASLAVAAKQRKVGTCGTVLWSVVVQTLGVNP